MQILWLAIRYTARLFGTQRKLWMPFALVAIVEALFLALVWLAPQPPFSKLLAPPIRYFFSDRMLHYPTHLWFLYHIMKHAHFLTSTLVGAFLTGVACVMVRQTHEGAPVSLREALVSKQVRYGTVLLLWLLTWGIATGLVEVLVQYFPPNPSVFWGSIGFTLVLQALFIYMIPAAVFEGLSWWRAMFRGAREAIRYPFSTLAAVCLPSALAILFALGAPSDRVASWMTQTAPEIAIPLVAARLAVWIVVDALMTVMVAHLWWLHRASREAASPIAAVPAGNPDAVRGAVAA